MQSIGRWRPQKWRWPTYDQTQATFASISIIVVIVCVTYVSDARAQVAEEDRQWCIILSGGAVLMLDHLEDGGFSDGTTFGPRNATPLSERCIEMDSRFQEASWELGHDGYEVSCDADGRLEFDSVMFTVVHHIRAAV